MSESVIVTLKHPDVRVVRDLELPKQVQVETLIPLVVKALDWPGPAPGLRYSLRTMEGSFILRPNETLDEAGVVTGNILTLVPVQCDTSPLDVRELQKKYPSLGGAVLISDSGQMFPLRSKSVLVGRLDLRNHIFPELDLTNLDTRAISSRRHAQIWYRGGEYWIKDLNSTNGTLVDGYRLGAGKRVRVRHGSQVQFGEGGPIFTFSLVTGHG